MKEIKVGVCEGRHPLPVEDYIFPQEVNPLEVEKLEAICFEKLEQITDKKNTTIKIYATGLTVAVLAVVKVAKQLFKEVVVMHYDRDSGNYYEQKM